MITIIPTDKVEQGSEEWKKLRSQYITATDVYNLLQGQSIQQILQQKANNTFRGNYYTERGHILEEEAKEIYSKVYQPTRNVGFVINDKYPLVGMSPDGLVGEEAFLDAFVRSANEGQRLTEEQWVAKWKRIEKIILRDFPGIPDAKEDLETINSYLDKGELIIHHSEAFCKAYNPHYRIIARDIFEKEIKPRITS